MSESGSKLMLVGGAAFALICLFLCGSSQRAPTSRKDLIGYFPSWKRDSTGRSVDPDRIPFEKLTLLNYAFFFPRPDGALAGRDTAGDRVYLGGSPSLIQKAHRRGVRVVLSVGGWEDSNNFPLVASDENRRRNFAKSCVDALRRFDFDGIDIDWEFPRLADHGGTPADRENCTRLLQTVRDSLDRDGRIRNRSLLLTAALPASAAGAENYEMRSVAGLLDMLNVMTYDFNGPWDSLSGHNAPLYAPRPDDSSRNVDAAFRLYSETLGIEPGRINLGVPFYAHSYSNCTELYTRHGGPDRVHFGPDGTFAYDIARLSDKFSKRWDERARVPFLVSSEWRTLVSCEDEQSAVLKAKYVVDHGARGLIIWEITGDLLPTGESPLLNAIDSVFSKVRN